MAIRTLGIFSPGSPPRREAFEAGLQRLQENGFTLHLGRTARAGEGLHAAAAIERTDDLHALLSRPEIDAILCARGGSGTLGLLPHIDYDRARAAAKPILGLSDVTALHLALFARSRLRGLACPVLVQFGPTMSEYTWSRWLDAVRGPWSTGTVSMPDGVMPAVLAGTPVGEAEGTLFPCNLSLLASLIGTPYLPSLDGAILVLEEIHETPQSLDRMVSSLRLSGVDRRLAAVVLGQFIECVPRNPDVTEEDGRAVVEEWARSLGVPVLTGFPFGHDAICTSLPFGTKARLTTAPPGLELLEPPPTLAAPALGDRR